VILGSLYLICPSFGKLLPWLDPMQARRPSVLDAAVSRHARPFHTGAPDGPRPYVACGLRGRDIRPSHPGGVAGRDSRWAR